MSEESLPKNSNEAAAAVARDCACQNCELIDRHGGERLLLTLMCPDGSEDMITLDLRDARNLLVQMAFALRTDKSPPSPAYGSRSWYSRRSILRAESKVANNIERVFDDVKSDMSDVSGFIVEELNGLKRVLARRGKSAAKPETIVARVRRSLLIAVEAMRADT